MKLLRMFKVALPVVAAWGVAACAVSAPARAEPMTPESLLKGLVQISTQEDLVDEKRVGELLGLTIVMIPEPPFTRKDGGTVTGSTAQVPDDPGYFATGGSHFYYRHITSPTRRATMLLNFDRRKLCVNYKDVLAAFGQHGELHPNAPPISAPSPPGMPRGPAPLKAQPVWGYSFKGGLSDVGLTFAYSECLTEFHIHQPVNDK